MNVQYDEISHLPEPLRTIYKLWSEYSAKSAESVLVHEVDKLDMALQASIYAKEGTIVSKFTGIL